MWGLSAVCICLCRWIYQVHEWHSSNVVTLATLAPMALVGSCWKHVCQRPMSWLMVEYTKKIILFTSHVITRVTAFQLTSSTTSTTPRCTSTRTKLIHLVLARVASTIVSPRVVHKVPFTRKRIHHRHLPFRYSRTFFFCTTTPAAHSGFNSAYCA